MPVIHKKFGDMMVVYSLFFLTNEGEKIIIKEFDMANPDDIENMVTLSKDKFFNDNFPDIANQVKSFEKKIPKQRQKAYYSKRWTLLKKARDDGFINYSKLNPYQRAMVRYAVARGLMRLDVDGARLTEDGIKFIDESPDYIRRRVYSKLRSFSGVSEKHTKDGMALGYIGD